MTTQLHEVEFETRTIGPLVLTTPVLRRLGCREMVHGHGPIAEQAELDHGLVAELVTQSWLSDPTAVYDLPGWAARFAIATRSPEIERTGQVNDDRAGRRLDALYDQRAVLWGDLVAHAARDSGLDLPRLHADTMAMTCAGLLADQPTDAGLPRLEPGDNPAGEWGQQLQLFALAAGDGGLPVGWDVLHGGTGDRPPSAPQCAAFSAQARLARFVPWEDMILLGDRKRPTAANQLTGLRLQLGYLGPRTLPDPHRQSLRALLAAGRAWHALPYGAQRESAKPVAQRTGYRGLGHSVEVPDPEDPPRPWSVRHLSSHASALAKREAARRDTAMPAIEAALQRRPGLGNTYDDKTPEVITRRVQSQAFKKRPAQTYFTIEVVPQADGPTASLALRSRVDHAQGHRDAALEGGYLLGAGGKAAARSEAELAAEWKGQYKVEHGFRLVNQLCLVPPLFLKTPQRIAALVLLSMVGALIAGRIERQVRRALAERQQPSTGVMPEGRDPLQPTGARLFKAFTDYSLGQGKDARGRVVEARFARLNPVQAHLLKLMGLPQPAELCAQPVRA
jgi:hypothetical protein